MEPNKIAFFGGFSILFHFSEYSVCFWGWFDSISLMYKMFLYDDVQKHFFSDKKEQLHFKEFRCGTPKANFHVQCGHFCGFFSLTKYIFGNTKFCIQNLIAQKT